MTTLLPGDPAPWFVARSNVNPRFQFDSAAGRYLVLTFFHSAEDPAGCDFLDEVDKHAGRFDVENVFFMGVSTTPGDEDVSRLRSHRPGMVYFFDFDLAISRLYGVEAGTAPRRLTLLLDPALRVLRVIPWNGRAAEHMAEILAVLQQYPPMSTLQGCAPVLVVPNVFERDFCRTLIRQYQAHGGSESGFMRDINGKTVLLIDHAHKRRTDFELTDVATIQKAQLTLRRRLLPEIAKAFQFSVTRIERNLIACYDSATNGHFRAHRDNTTKGTAHRRFAVTINLNSEEFEGGQLWFPEFGRRAYKAPTGGAVIFSCSLLHEARPVTKGVRYAFLPFLYDEAAAHIRAENRHLVDLTNRS
ncbi:2OG-Fe(II) oxygenase [Anatilimnocola floriformis]|uniref:2OG-Fe(II) oxygenase n=1 Tax=Anatilimnocola floriformis TaxID=2948575 RepID=UPI0020C52BE2|nr:2OG-Fe(II) oxygenase [Anatilimnocola floriformis]